MPFPPDIAVISRRRRREGGSAKDPLGAGNTTLISALAVTPVVFYDVRKNLTLSGSNVTSLKDVSGAGTYGPILNGNSTPTWDGTLINTNGTSYLLSASTATGLDLSLGVTVVIVCSTTAAVGKVYWAIGAAAGATPYVRGITKTGPVYGFTSDTNGTGDVSTVSATSTVRLCIHTTNGAHTLTTEIPSTTTVTNTVGTTSEAAGNQLICLGATTAGTAGGPIGFRALVAWQGTYTTAQRDTLKTWAQTYHGAVFA